MQNWVEEEEYDIEACTRSSSRSRLVPSSLNRNGSLICGVPFLFIDSFSKRSLSYDKLPVEPLGLTILKLDGTSFEIEVSKNGTVAELKQAVEDFFSHLPKRGGTGMVSWSHVWGHFCLYYDGQKLLSDDDYLGSYGIQDGDQLRFIRHVSINYNLTRMRSEREESYLDEPTTSRGYEGSQLNGVEYQCHGEDVEHQISSDDNDYNADKEDKSIIRSCEYRLARLFRGLFSYHKLTNSDTRIERRSNSSKFSNNLLGSFSNVLRLSYTNEYDPSQRETWKGK